MKLWSPLRFIVASACLAALVGCSDDSGSKSGTPKTPATGGKSPIEGDAKTSKASTSTGGNKNVTLVSSNKVVTLGSDELTAGIPGQGALTSEQLNTWLEDPANHEPLQVKLPLGLDAGQSAIQGLADNPLTRAKIELGRQLYFEKRLSANGTVSCATCHAADKGWAAPTQFGVGINGQQGGRNSPVSYNRILSSIQFWDGRAATLEEQAKGPIANPIEMGNTHAAAVKTIQAIEGYRPEFQTVFGEPPTIDNIAKAIASFERTVVTGPSAYDYFERKEQIEKQYAADLKDLGTFRQESPEIVARYETLTVGAAAKPMSDSAKRGRDLFFGQKASCTACHVGPNFSDEKYHNLGVGMDKKEPDLGRYAITKDEKDRGAFKTPTVRNVALTAPYMHDGSQKTLEEVVEWYDKGGHANPRLDEKIKKLNLTKQEKAELVEFMKSLTGEFPRVETGRLPQ